MILTPIAFTSGTCRFASKRGGMFITQKTSCVYYYTTLYTLSFELSHTLNRSPQAVGTGQSHKSKNGRNLHHVIDN